MHRLLGLSVGSLFALHAVVMVAAQTPQPEPPAAPTDLRIEQPDQTSVVLIWTDNADNEDGFRVRKAVGGGSPQVIAEVGADVTNALIGVVPLEEQCDGAAFDVIAFNRAGESAPSVALTLIATDCQGFATPTPSVISLRPENDGRITWQAVPGAASYRISGTFDAVRTSASRLCDPPALAPGETSGTFDQTLAGSATEFQIPLPTLPPEDAWFVFNIESLRIEAFGPSGEPIAIGVGGFIAETRCPDPTSSPTVRAVLLPRTGTAGSSVGTPVLPVALTVLATVVAGSLASMALRTRGG